MLFLFNKTNTAKLMVSDYELYIYNKYIDRDGSGKMEN